MNHLLLAAKKKGYWFHVYGWQRGQRAESLADAGWPEGRGQADGYPTGKGCGL